MNQPTPSEAQQRELGFTLPGADPDRRDCRRQVCLQEREVLLVLELDGNAYRQAWNGYAGTWSRGGPGRRQSRQAGI